MERTVILSGGSPWGFTLAGGRDFGSHLQVSKLTNGGKAALGGVKENDFIIKINDKETQGVTHFGAQQLIKSSGSKLTLLLTNEAPLKSAYAPAQTTPSTQTTPTSDSGSRPRPPPPPTDVTPTSTTPSPPSNTSPVKATAKSPAAKSVRPVQPISRPPVVTDNSENDPIFQSPTFKKITSESPSAFSPKSTGQNNFTPPSQQMKHMTIEDGNTRKSTQRPPPPANTPSTFTPTTMRVSSTNKGTSPAKPSPPAAVKRPAPPPSVPAAPPSPSQPPPVSGNTPQNKVTARQGVCEACHEPIRGAYSSAMNKVWHPEHFICSYCRTQLSGGTFIFEDDKIFCDTCYERKVAQICSLCRKSIVGPMVNATNRYYHQQCFRCTKCSVNLSQQDGFNMENNMLYCSDCFGEVYGVTCHGCGQKIGGNDLWVEALEHNWHPQCFVCQGCGRNLEGSKFFAKLGRPYCGQC